MKVEIGKGMACTMQERMVKIINSIDKRTCEVVIETEAEEITYDMKAWNVFAQLDCIEVQEKGNKCHSILYRYDRVVSVEVVAEWKVGDAV